MDQKAKAVLVLEDGTVFHGTAIGKKGKSKGELVFNTSMAGYQEIFTDPSYHGQIIVMSTSHVGNYGVNSNDAESDVIRCEGIVVKKFSEVTSRKLAEASLQELMEHSNKAGISDIDTRELVRHLRDNGSMNGVISSEDNFDIEELLKEAKALPSMVGQEISSKLSTKEILNFPSTTEESTYKIALIDYGAVVKLASYLNTLSCDVTIYPMDTPLAKMLEGNPDGFVLSNGLGDASTMTSSIELVKEMIATDLPVFGINMGYQLLALSQGLKIEKMVHGHRGSNHPVINHLLGKAEITSQNHGFVVTRESAEANKDVVITHSHLNDNTVAGIALKGKKAFGVQYHPEPTAGPHDSIYLFNQFIEYLKK